MTKKLKTARLQMSIAIGLFLVVCVIGAGIGTRAYVSDEAPQTVMENVTIKTYNEAATVTIVEEEFGAVVSPDIASRYLSVTGDVTFHITGSFADATTTIIAIVDPFLMATSTVNEVAVLNANTANAMTGATSTVELVRLNVTGVATSTYQIRCGAAPATGKTASTTIDYEILTSDSITASTFIGVVENNITSSYGAKIGGGSVAKILLTPVNPYLVCVVSSSDNGAFTNPANTFDGTYMVRISKTRF